MPVRGVYKFHKFPLISIDTKNNLTAEITLPSKVISGVTLYYFLRACDMKGIEVDFEPDVNKALG